MSRQPISERAELTAKQEAFCIAYVQGDSETRNNATMAYRFAFNQKKLSQRNATNRAYATMKNPAVQVRIRQLKNAVVEQTRFKAVDVFNQWVDIALGDPADFVQVRYVCCRYCHGVNHQYQWKTEREYLENCAQAFQDKTAMPNNFGGYGFNVSHDPHPKCPECGGIGVRIVYLTDTRKLTKQARLLYDGVKVTKDGIQILFRDRCRALENIAKYLGMYKESQKPGDNTPPIDSLKNAMIDAVQAAKIYQQIMKGS